MKKLLLPLAIGSALSLVGCGSGDEAPLTEQEVNVAATRVAFDPSNSVLPVPTNILLSGSVDGTLNIPVADATDNSDPQVALNGLDGWGTHPTMTFSFNLPVDEDGNTVTVDPTSLEAEGAIRVFEAVQGGTAGTPEACQTASPAAVCAIAGELTQGTDFVVKATSGNSVAIVPLHPLKPKTGYVVALTNNIQDSLGRNVQGSQTYTLMKRSVATDPVSADPSAQALQSLINSYEAALAEFGVDTSTVIYSSNFTTESAGDVLKTAKALMAQQIAAGAQPVLNATFQGYTADVVLQNQLGVTDPTALAAASAARVYEGEVTLPYYLPVPTAENPTAPLNGRWMAQCDSPASILGAIEAGIIDPAEVGIPPEALSDPSLLLPPAGNCYDFPGIDTERHLTKYNPIPAKTADMTVKALVTIPDLATVNAIRASRGMSTLAAAPANGWPVVIFSHGITSNKESAYGIVGSLAAAGFATVAIDQPLHGERGFDLDGDGTDEINASSAAGATAYMNLASLLTTRDNLRQSIIDIVDLRASLNFFVADDGRQIDGSKVYFVGHSLGAITGVTATAIADEPFADSSPLAALNSYFDVQASSFAMPGGSIANFLLSSDTFAPVIKSQLLYAANADFAAAVNAAAEQQGVAPNSPQFQQLLISVYEQFIAGASAAEVAQINATFEQFAFAAQAVVDSGDPVNFADEVVANGTPVHLIEAIGDSVIPNAVEGKPLAGTEPLINLLGLPSISTTVQSEDGTPVSGAVRFPEATHGSIVDPSASPASTTEMQTEIYSWFGSGMTRLPISNEDVVQ
ncbi:alpha/beta hydrolase [Idiomarina tyrosinivorans]|uniref:Alpha/beta hydrolase n=1 Tax=Idiomarina tyrosinivorans TaxID=1445662 RepID=A0A432ZPC4_9GAMM|nr:VolA/Pla-1 family phospholipase [Idiomarina tyrosinivorans]RUO79737.1 alpha/beta hydrolase [Idiomarina tyrosinivorans]